MSTTSTNAAVDPFERIVALLQDPRPTAKGVRARCPAHDDHTPSLDVDRGDDGRVLLTCRSAQCSPQSIVAALGLEMRDLFPQGGRPRKLGTSPTKPKKELKRHPTADDAVRANHWSATDGTYAGKVTRYTYQDGNGNDVGIVVRIDFDDGRRKAIRRVSRDGDAWLCRDMPAPKPLYRLPGLLAAPPEEPVLVVEGEKCADALEALGFLTTTSAGGANAPLADTDWSPLAGRRVVILPDNDDAGRTYRNGVVRQARADEATSLHVLDLDGLGEGEDVFDWAEKRHAAGNTRDEVIAELRQLLTTAGEPSADEPESTIEAGDLNEQSDAGHRGLVELGQRDPATDRLVLSPKKTLPTAEAFIREFYSHADGRMLHDHAGMLLAWQGNRYVEIEEGFVKKKLHAWLHNALRYIYDKKTDSLQLTDFEGNPGTVRQALETTRSYVHLPAATATPSWLGPGDPPASVHEIMPCKTMSLHIPSGRVLLPTPVLFNVNALDFNYDPNPAEPVRWLAFLHQLLGDDIESFNLLQEWVGYCLTADTRQQKMLLLVGPRRSGKGTIGRVLARLVGTANVVGPTIGGLTGPFGLQPLLGKTLAIVSDARFTGEGMPVLVERLLCISGEDAITVDRKHIGSVTMKLPTRFMFLTNELPRFNDASTALAGRFVVLRLTKSFYGCEDVDLEAALLAELPGILTWALLGWHRLADRRRFLEPESSRVAVQDIEDLSSPVQAFVRDRCVVGPGHRISVPDLYIAWQSWCTADGRTTCTTKQIFGRDLAAAVPGVTRRRSTGMLGFYEGIGLTSGGMS